MTYSEDIPMSETKSKFRTNQQEYFDPIEQVEDGVPAPSNGKFIAVVALGILGAVTLATLLSVKF
jgi:hypothetical protein